MSDINIHISTKSIARAYDQLITRFSHLNGNDILFIVAAILLPPLAVYLKVGASPHFWINLVLTMLGYVPGQIHALWVVLFLP